VNLLLDLSQINTESGEARRVITDRQLLGWAHNRGISPGEAQILALQNEIIPLRYLRNLNGLSLHDQLRICRSRLLVCGCGGLGGVLVQMLLRLGAGYLRLIDGDTFAESNLNRQWLCSTATIGQPKPLVARDVAGGINPFTKVSAVVADLTAENAEEALIDSDLALDALDDLPARFQLAQTARSLGIPFIHGAATGWWGQVSTFLPEDAVGLAEIYGERRSRDPAEAAGGVLAPTPTLIASLQTFEAIRLLTGKPAAYARKLLYFDGESGHMELLPLRNPEHTKHGSA
jgi:molybdopterin-synthase adenylyltransferase